MKLVLGMVVVFGAMGLVGHMDYEDQIAAERAECAHLQKEIEQGLTRKHLPEQCKVDLVQQ